MHEYSWYNKKNLEATLVLLKENNLPDIRWHDLRATFATILIKNDFNLKCCVFIFVNKFSIY